jgi:hypothetical protein
MNSDRLHSLPGEINQLGQRDRCHFEQQMGAIMDTAGPNEKKHDGLSININAQCNNHIYSGDHIEVHIHRGGGPSGDLRVQDERDETRAESAALGSDRVEIIVPQAMRIVRQIRSA